MDGGSRIITALEATWAVLQRAHPELPGVVFITGSARAQKGGDRWGHHWPERWRLSQGRAAELFIAGELMAHGGARVLQVLLHEAAHAVAHARGVKDTSRSGNRYHNRRFAALAAEVGLVPPAAPSAGHGYADCALPGDTAQRYAATIAALDAAALAYLEDRAHINGGGGTHGGRGGRRLAVTCGCGRRLQITPKVYDQGAILCGLCGSVFQPGTAENRPI